MKKKVINVCLLAAILLSAGMVKAQTIAVKTNLLAPIVMRTATLQLEGAVADRASLQFGLMYQFKKTTGDLNTGRQEYDALGVMGEFRYYMSNDVMRGFYLGPYLMFNSKVYTYERQNGTSFIKETPVNLYGGGALLGYQFLFGNRFSLDLHGGAGYLQASREDIETENGASVPAADLKDGFQPTFGVSLGLAF